MNLSAAVEQGVRMLLRRKGAVSRHVQIGTHAVHFYEMPGHGSERPVVYVHGLGGSAHSFSRLLEPLRSRFRRQLVLDLPGSGFSPLPQTGPLRFLEQQEVLERFLTDVAGGPVFLVGNSLGGAMALHLATQHPELVSALALIAPAGATVSEERMAALLESLDIRTHEQARQLAHRLFQRKTLLPYLISPDLLKRYNAPAVRALHREAPTLPPLDTQAMASLTMPVLLLWGEGERLLPYEGIEFFKKHLAPHAHIEIVPGYGHIPQVERPASVASKLKAFADAHAL